MHRNQSLESGPSVAPRKEGATRRAWSLLGRAYTTVTEWTASPWVRSAGVLSALLSLSLVGRCSLASPASGTAVPPPLAVERIGTAVPEPTPAADAEAARAETPQRLPSPPSSKATAEDPVVLNQATVEDLRRLPRIGPKKAEAILALRQKLGRFRQVEDLLRVKGIGRATLKKLRPLLRVDPPPAPALTTPQPSAPLTLRISAPRPPSFSSIFS